VRVRVGEVVRALREPDAHRGDRDAPAVEDLEELVEPLATRPEQVAFGHGAVGERELAGVGGLPAELVEGLRDRVARCPVFDDDVRDLVLAGAGGDRHAPRELGARVGDEHLRAVDDPGAVAELCGRAGRAGVGARVGLGQPERREPTTRREVGQPALPLLVGAEEGDRHRPERRVRGDGDRDGGVDPRQLLDGDRVRDRVAAGAAVALLDRYPHQPELGHLAYQLDGEARLAIELLRQGRDALARERADGVADQLLLWSEVEVHAARDPSRRPVRHVSRAGARPTVPSAPDTA
jgi:hypothetical protein